jgi:DNA mismatch endonuclease, patch repair protein
MARDKATTYRIMSAVKSRNTSPELLLGSAMWGLGIRYRKHYKIKGRPDFVLVSKRIAIFCDGDFWHGNNWRIRGISSRRKELAGYSEFWRTKIKKNIERDKLVSKQLKKESWRVIRFWESEIKSNAQKCARQVLRVATV